MYDPSEPRICHIDMDSYFVSTEILRYPDLKGVAAVVGGGSQHQPKVMADGTRQYARLKDYVGRGVVTTSTYEARALGVFSGMGLMKSAKLAPEAVLLPTDFQRYKHYSVLFKNAVRSIAPTIQDVGIDEIYVDLNGIPDDVRTIAQSIKDAVREATEGLTCSIGLAQSKLVAKIASDLQKPNGLTIVPASAIPDIIWPLAVGKVNGIGPKASSKLNTLGIMTIGDLAKANPALLQETFGRTYSEWLLRAAHGIDRRPVTTERESKSMSRETTFDRDLHPKGDRERLGEIFTRLCIQVSEDLKRKGYVGRTVGIKLRFHDFQTVTRDYTVPEVSDDPVVIRRAATECLRRVKLDKRIRLLGVRVSTLERKDPAQMRAPRQTDLFDSV
ncbi:DNA polymerase IV [Noviherbaspirillum sp. CPCC 100848]|uniref:DNA polymerase IV n=1 Tax=Noviherbaspirillum album TaxID=3080276 RepID=A0ABU6J8R4_9BURK|nr:DNA polymerase IV [Noviherbaspirillum sp. CPCC 100848]MEC4720052.1 DNA polymerase IV [Noviherbaspirillum sp. CPCC 100848]